uniref:IBB domain-containing protein n=1 Tax=Steinernema glaseri TaxID=37863 RepID=A0A1I7Y1A0_9BILA
MKQVKRRFLERRKAKRAERAAERERREEEGLPLEKDYAVGTREQRHWQHQEHQRLRTLERASGRSMKEQEHGWW